MNPDNCMASQISLKDIKQCVNKPNVNGLCIYHYMDYVNKKVIPRMDQPLDENTIEHFLNMYTILLKILYYIARIMTRIQIQIQTLT